jgi:hypothetical protein
MTGRVTACGALPVLLCLLALGGMGCAARKPVGSLSDLSRRVHRGHTVYVLDDAGIETKGTVNDVSSSALVLDVNGALRQIDGSRIRQVDRYGDSLWNGFLIGAGVGAAAALISDPQYKPCEGQPLTQCADYQVGRRVAIVPVMGAAGAGIDALVRRRHLVYLASNKPSASRARVLFYPVIISSGFGVVGSVHFRSWGWRRDSGL